MGAKVIKAGYKSLISSVAMATVLSGQCPVMVVTRTSESYDVVGADTGSLMGIIWVWSF